MTIQSWINAGTGSAPKLEGLLATNAMSDAALMTMRAPPEVPTPLWTLSSASERRAMVEVLPMMTAVSAVALPVGSAAGHQVAIDVSALVRGLGGVGSFAVLLSRAGVVGMVLSLGGSTPQPAQQDIKFGNLTLRLTAPRAGAEIGAEGTRAQFRADKPGWVHFGEGTRRLDVPVIVSGGQLRFDAKALENAYGRPLPDAISQMARPANVARPLQTTSRGAAQAMAGAPDPCKFFGGGQNHHMIPAASMQSNQRLLTAIGFKLDQPANMIRLPKNGVERTDMAQMCGQTRPTHNGPHGSGYTNAVNRQLDGIWQRLQSREIGVMQARTEVDSLMSQIRRGLSSGQFGNSTMSDVRIAAFIRSIKP